MMPDGHSAEPLSPANAAKRVYSQWVKSGINASLRALSRRLLRFGANHVDIDNTKKFGLITIPSQQMNGLINQRSPKNTALRGISLKQNIEICPNLISKLGSPRPYRLLGTFELCNAAKHSVKGTRDSHDSHKVKIHPGQAMHQIPLVTDT